MAYEFGQFGKFNNYREISVKEDDNRV